jgi:hypothetical protein
VKFDFSKIYIGNLREAVEATVADIIFGVNKVNPVFLGCQHCR